MQPSPIQLKDMKYLGIKVVARQPVKEEENELEPDFDFGGVTIGEQIWIEILGDKNEPEMFAVGLRINIDNNEGKQIPYDIDVQATGIFSISTKIEKEKREELVLVNGCAVLYSAFRDQIMTLTARSYHGPLILPTVNFIDLVKKKEAVNTEEKLIRKTIPKTRKKP